MTKNRKLMKSLSLILLNLLGATLGLLAQNSTARGSEKYAPFLKTTTLIVLDEDSAYSRPVKEAVEAYWTITPYEFITEADLTRYAGDEAYSMLARNNAQRTVRRAKNTVLIRNNEIGLYLCRDGMLENLLAGDAVTYIRAEQIYDTEAYAYKLAGLIQAMHTYLEDFLGRGDITRDNFDELEAEYFTRGHKAIREHVLLINREEMPEELQDEAALQKVYALEAKLVSPDEITAAILEQKEGVAYLHLHPAYRTIQVIAARGGQTLYSAGPKDYNSFGKKDLKAIARAAN